MAIARSNSLVRHFSKYRIIVILAVLWVAVVGYGGWRFVIRPWSIAKEVVVGSTEQQVVDLLGQPDLDFRSDDELRSSWLVPGSYVFTPIPGPNGEWPLTAGWLFGGGGGQPVSADGMPAIEERAIWYELPMTAGILLYLTDGKVTRMYHGGT